MILHILMILGMFVCIGVCIIVYVHSIYVFYVFRQFITQSAKLSRIDAKICPGAGYSQDLV